MKRRTKQKATEVDRMVGENLRRLRMIKGVSQAELADKIGVSFQQLQKYEKGINRISAGMLYNFTKIFKVRADEFFHLGGSGVDPDGKVEQLGELEIDRNVMRLVKSFQALPSTELKNRILSLVKTLAADGGEEEDDE